jgi:hypothetical protein
MTYQTAKERGGSAADGATRSIEVSAFRFVGRTGQTGAMAIFWDSSLRPLALAGVGLGAIVLSGCGAATVTTTTPSPHSARVAPATTTTRTHHPPRRRPPRHHPARRQARHTTTRRHVTSPGLRVSAASATVIQAQPPAGACQAQGHGAFSLPDPRCTPGALSPAVTQASISSTICRSGYTETVRPSESITEPEKEASLRSYGDAGPLHIYEYDHLVPLELGGATNDPRNLWPEPGASPNAKDELENRLRELVCSGQMTLSVAQRAIARDWVTLYRRLMG